MTPIERFHRCQFESEQLESIDSGIAVRETSLGDGHDAEIEALSEASEHLLKARKALELAKAEARRECEQELLHQQLTASVAQFRNRTGAHVS